MAHRNRQRSSWLSLLMLLIALLLVGMLGALPGAAAQGRGGVLRIGMTAADIPYTGGQPDQGFEGFRFIGFQVYEGLTRWDLSQGDRLPGGRGVRQPLGQPRQTRALLRLRTALALGAGTGKVMEDGIEAQATDQAHRAGALLTLVRQGEGGKGPIADQAEFALRQPAGRRRGPDRG